MQECAVCNKAISPDRLSAQPRAVTCSASCVQEYRKRLNRRSSSAARRRKAVGVQPAPKVHREAEGVDTADQVHDEGHANCLALSDLADDLKDTVRPVEAMRSQVRMYRVAATRGDRQELLREIRASTE